MSNERMKERDISSGRGGVCEWVSVCFGGSGSDSRQRGSVMAGYWIRLQPELPQYTQYNVPLCSPAACPAHICSWGPSCLEDHNHDKNTPTKITRRATEVRTHTAPAGKTEPDTPRETRRGKYETRQGRKTESRGGTNSLSLLSFFSDFPFHRPVLP